MINPKSISTSQMGYLLIAGTTGSAIVYIPNPLIEAANNGAWISLILSYGYGMIILGGILYLHRMHIGLSLVGYSRHLIGNFATVVISIPLIGMLFFAVPGIVAGIGDFFTVTMMRETPVYVFNSISLMIAALTVRAGIRVMARMFTFLVLILLIFAVLVMVLALPMYDPEYLLPFLPQGLKPVFHGSYITAGFPYGEVVLFSMLLPFVRSEKKPALRRRLFVSLTVTCFMLLCSTLCTIMAFGPSAGLYKYSLYILAREIQIVEIIQRVESIIGMALMFGSYMKTVLFLFILNQILTEVFRFQNDRTFIFPITMVCIMLSLTMFDNEADFNEQVYTIWPLFVLIVSSLLVGLFSIITMIKKRNKK